MAVIEILWKPSTRPTLMLEVVRELKSIGVEVEFQKENIKTLSGDGEFMLAILSSFAEEESRSISENIKWRIKRQFKEGKLIINTERFFGYDKDDYGGLVVNHKEAKIIQRIFTEYLSGKGCFTIAKELNRDKIPTVTGAKWHENTLMDMLKNEKYKGDVHLQKYYTPHHLKGQTVRNKGNIDSYYIKGNHPLIISEETWGKVQEEIEKRSYKDDTKKYANKYPLSGKLICSKCGFTLRRKTIKRKYDDLIFWQCSNYINNGKASCPGTKIDDVIISKINIEEETIVGEVEINGKTNYIYTSKNEQLKPSREPRTPEIKDGSLLQGIDRSVRTVIKL